MNIQQIAVIGAGTMGSGIAQACAQSGLDVVMVDVSIAALERGRTALVASLDRLVQKEKISAAQKDETLRRIRSTVSYQELKDSDLVIEAATENLELKIRILHEIESVVGDDTVIASNTSSISITQLAAALQRPGRCIGMHFFNPVPVMALLEVIRGLQTTDATHAVALDFAKAVGKTAITVRNSPVPDDQRSDLRVAGRAGVRRRNRCWHEARLQPPARPPGAGGSDRAGHTSVRDARLPRQPRRS
jgi:3-hydroxybutyryl-CoA dehydrogenase